LPENCPSCGALLDINEVDAVLRCNNTWCCSDQILERLAHFASRDALNIVGMGKKQLKFLLQNNFISNALDIFYLEQKSSALDQYERWGQRSVQNLLQNINNAKTTSLDKFIYALGIRYIGQNNALILAKEFVSAENFIAGLINLSNNDQDLLSKLDSIDGLGQKILQGLIQFVEHAANLELINKLVQILQIKEYKQQTSSPISGLNIVFTGSLGGMSRSEAKALAESMGAKVSSSISAETNILVAGDKSGSKLKKAALLGVKVMLEEEWLSFLQKS